jgi:hypothetical protein
MTKEEVIAIREQLYATAEYAGLKIISNDNCCRLLAWLYLYGGENEAVVVNDRQRNLFTQAQRRLNLFGGEIPNMELVPVLQGYIKSVEDYSNLPEWVIDLEKEFGLKAYGRHKK